MNRKQRNRILAVIGIVLVAIIAAFLYRLTLNCCALPPNTTGTAIVALNQTIDGQIHQTQTSTFQTAISHVVTPTPSSYPYDPTLYAQRRHEELILQTASGPDDYATFYAEETALVATYQGTVLPTSTPIPYTASMSPTPTPFPSPTSSVHDSNCAFSWAHQDLPEITTAAREALSTISMAKIDVLRADAYGENCNRADGSLSYFAAMTTDFYLSVDVTDLNDANQLAQIVKTAYTVLTELKVKLPAQAGYLDITFTTGQQQKRFRAMFDQIKANIDEGRSAPALLELGKM